MGLNGVFRTPLAFPNWVLPGNQPPVATLLPVVLYDN